MPRYAIKARIEFTYLVDANSEKEAAKSYLAKDSFLDKHLSVSLRNIKRTVLEVREL